MRCPDCDQGLRETLPAGDSVGNGKCRACHGKGEIEGEPCETCMGTGACQTCGGSGIAED
jgi:hypothetical protein